MEKIKFTDSLMEIGGYILAAIGLFFSAQIKKWFISKQFFDPSKMITKNVQVRDYLIELRALIEADRVKLFQFHNGEYYVSGESVMKLSMTHVSVRTGISYPELANTHYSSIPTSYLTRILQSLYKEEFLIIHANSLEEDQYLKHIFVAHGIKTAILYPVANAHGQWIGIIMAVWLGDIEPSIDLLDLQSSSAKIGQLLLK